MSGTTITPQPSRQRIRFKFMPTPSGPLHAGHAWLLILMDRLAARARAEGHEADLVLVIDELTHRHADEQTHNQLITNMLDDLNWLGIDCAHVVSNRAFPYDSATQSHPMRSISCALFAPPCLYRPHLNTIHSGSSYFVKNCIIDAALEVTHIIRGADQLARASAYLTVYEMLEVPAPRMVYLPFVCRPDGNKITAGNGYTLQAIREKVSREELFKGLVLCCLRAETQDSAEPWTLRDTEARLLGTDWQWVLGTDDADVRLRAFLKRLLPSPKMDISDLPSDQSEKNEEPCEASQG